MSEIRQPRRRWKGERLNERISVGLTAGQRLRLNELAGELNLGEGEAARLAITEWLAGEPAEKPRATSPSFGSSTRARARGAQGAE